MDFVKAEYGGIESCCGIVTQSEVAMAKLRWIGKLRDGRVERCAARGRKAERNMRRREVHSAYNTPPASKRVPTQSFSITCQVYGRCRCRCRRVRVDWVMCAVVSADQSLSNDTNKCRLEWCPDGYTTGSGYHSSDRRSEPIITTVLIG